MMEKDAKGITLSELKQVLSKLMPTLFYSLNEFCPMEDENGTAVLFYLSDSDCVLLHPRNAEAFTASASASGYLTSQLSDEEFYARNSAAIKRRYQEAIKPKFDVEDWRLFP